MLPSETAPAVTMSDAVHSEHPEKGWAWPAAVVSTLNPKGKSPLSQRVLRWSVPAPQLDTGEAQQQFIHSSLGNVWGFYVTDNSVRLLAGDYFINR